MIQESYCLISELDEHEHIVRPDCYFFRTARNLVVRRSARAKIAPFVPMVDEEYRDEQPYSERDAGARMALERAMTLLASVSLTSLVCLL